MNKTEERLLLEKKLNVCIDEKIDGITTYQYLQKHFHLNEVPKECDRKFLFDFCKKMKTSCLIVDENGYIISKYIGKSRKFKALYCVYSTDLFPITDSNTIRRLARKKNGKCIVTQLEKSVQPVEEQPEQEFRSIKLSFERDEKDAWKPIPYKKVTESIKFLISKYGKQKVEERIRKHFNFKVEKIECKGREKIDFIKNYHCRPYESHNGIFHDYLIRRILCEYVRIPFFDRAAINVLKSEKTREISKNIDLDRSYNICCDMQKKTNDIIPHIYKISLCHSLRFANEIPEDEYSLKFNSYPYSNFSEFIRENILIPHEGEKYIINPIFGMSAYVQGEPDFIAGRTLYDIKVTKDKSIYIWAQIILYSCLASIQGIEIDRCCIFNLLDGNIYQIKVDISLESRVTLLWDFFGDEEDSEEYLEVPLENKTDFNQKMNHLKMNFKND